MWGFEASIDLTFAAFIFLLRSLESNACMYVWLDNAAGNASDFGVLDLFPVRYLAGPVGKALNV